MQGSAPGRRRCRFICVLAILLVLRSGLEWQAATPARVVAFALPRLLGGDLGDGALRTTPQDIRRGAAVPSGQDQGRRSASIAVVLGLGSAGSPDLAWAGGIDAARDKLLASAKILDDVLASYDAIVKSSGGDGVRVQLKQLSDLQKACQELALSAEDPDQFTAALEEFALATSRANGNLYSSVFAGGSGDPKKNNPKIYLNLAKDDIGAMRGEVGKMLKALGGAAMS